MPAPFSRVLVPMDFSDHSDRALEYATALAGGTGASLHLLNVVEPVAAVSGEMYISMPELTDNLAAEALRRLREHKEGIPPGLAVTVDVAVGLAAVTIAQAATDQKCDLIVMGTHGRTGLAHLFMGSVAERVTRLAPCPVLTVRQVTWAAGAGRLTA